MTDESFQPADILADSIINALGHPILMVDENNGILYANGQAEDFFLISKSLMLRQKLQDILPLKSPVLSLVDQVRERGNIVHEYRVDLSSPRLGPDKLVDIHLTPNVEYPLSVVIMFQEKSVSDKIDRQMAHRGSARSVTGLAAMLAHEIKNPLSGIRGAAQLLEPVVSDQDRTLTQLIINETDRIVTLVDRMEVFSDQRPIDCEPVNIHTILAHVKTVAHTGFARNIRIIEDYDPSLPFIYGNRNQLIQIFINLIKNSAEAIENKENGEIKISTSYRSGIGFLVPGSNERVKLPLEFCVHDNGPGVPEDVQPIIFDPFITTKLNGSGLGLALVAKIINAHGGVIECETSSFGTTFRILMPAWTGSDAREQPHEGDNA